MTFLYYVLFAALVVGLDQFTKFLTVAYIPLGESLPFLPGVLQLSHIQNTGAAFSSFEGQHWLFALIFLVFTVLVLWEYFKKPLPLKPFECWCVAAIYGGGLGNMIDRVRLGYVVDMLDTVFVNFPVFNVADIFITCGSILLFGHLFFFNKAFWKEENKK